MCFLVIILSTGACFLIFFEYDLFISQVKLWDAERRSCIGTGKGHLGAVGSVAFSKKSKNFFVSGSRFVFQFLWDICLPKVMPNLLF